MDGDPHKPLRDDVRLLGELLGDTLRAYEGEELFARVEEVRALAKRAHAGDAVAFESLADRLADMPIGAAVPIARAFSHFLTLANIAEQHHRVRRRRDYARDRVHAPQPGSCAEAFARWRRGGLAPERLAEAVRTLQIELVLTAHPTEVVRRTLLQTHRRIADALAEQRPPRLDARGSRRSRSTRSGARSRPSGRPTRCAPTRCRRSTRCAAPSRSSSRRCGRRCPASSGRSAARSGEPLPLDAAPLRFGSWIGGDRDGNPNVTPEITRRATWMARWVAADLYAREIEGLRAELSMASASDELRAVVGDSAEPYRALLRGVSANLLATRQLAAERIEQDGALDADGGKVLLHVVDLAEPLLLCHRSLVATGNALIAGGRLTDILRRVAAFGLTLAPLDLRQEAARHADAVAWIARAWHLGSYEDASEEERVAMLTRELTEGTRTFADLPSGDRGPTDTVRDVLDTFRTAAALPPESLGAYVITMASRVSDVLAVEWLQKLAGNRHPQRVVPLFETAADLQASGRSARRALLAAVVSRAHRRPSGGDDRLLRFGQGRRPFQRRVGALLRAGADRRHLRAAQRPPDALSRARRQRRPRRRPDASGDPFSAARVNRRPPARHRARRDDPGEVRPPRHRRSHPGGLHDGDARSDPDARGRSTDGLAHGDGAAVRRVAHVVPRRRLRTSAVHRVLPCRDARAGAASRSHRQPAGAPEQR